MTETYQHQDARLFAGTLVYFKETTEEETAYKLWNGLTALGDIGSTGSFVEDTTIADKIKTYIAAMKDTSELDFEFYLYKTDTNQDKLRALAIAGTSVDIKIEYNAGYTAEFKAALNGFVILGSNGDEGTKAKINMRISGDTTITVEE